MIINHFITNLFKLFEIFSIEFFILENLFEKFNILSNFFYY